MSEILLQLEACEPGEFSRMPTRGVLHTVSPRGVGVSVGVGNEVGEDGTGDRASGGAGGRPSRLFFFLGNGGGAEKARVRRPATVIGDGGDGGGERRLHCVRRPATLPAFLF